MKQERSPKKRYPKSSLSQAGRSALSERLAGEFADFVEYHSAKEFSRNLRKMLLEFLRHEGAVDNVYLKDLLYDIDGLFDLLDIIESEQLSDGEERTRRTSREPAY